MNKRIWFIGVAIVLMDQQAVMGSGKVETAVDVYDKYLEVLNNTKDVLPALDKDEIRGQVMNIDKQARIFNKQLANPKIPDAGAYKAKLDQVKKEQKEFIEATLAHLVPVKSASSVASDFYPAEGLSPEGAKEELLQKYRDRQNPEDGKIGDQTTKQELKLKDITLTQYPAINQMLFEPDQLAAVADVTNNCGYFATWFAHLFADDPKYADNLKNRGLFVEGLGSMIDVVIDMRKDGDFQLFGVEALNDTEIAPLVNALSKTYPMNNVFYVGTVDTIGLHSVKIDPDKKDSKDWAPISDQPSDVQKADAIKWLAGAKEGSCNLILISQASERAAAGGTTHWVVARVTKSKGKVSKIEFANSLSDFLFDEEGFIYGLLDSICKLTGQKLFDILTYSDDPRAKSLIYYAFDSLENEWNNKTEELAALKKKLEALKQLNIKTVDENITFGIIVGRMEELWNMLVATKESALDPDLRQQFKDNLKVFEKVAWQKDAYNLLDKIYRIEKQELKPLAEKKTQFFIEVSTNTKLKNSIQQELEVRKMQGDAGYQARMERKAKFFEDQLALVNPKQKKK